MTEMTHPTAAVVVVTYNRPAHVRTCLEHLAQQTCPPLETVVVDASPDRRTADVVAEFPGVRFLRNDLGMGYMATSRAIGVAATIADVVAFIDDDAYAEPDWIERLLLPYADPRVGAVGGRARNGNSGEESEGADQVGLLLPDGTLTGFFAAITPGDIEVDHLIGCNMSYRRRALQAIGGIHDHWPGTSLREDADTGLRMRRAGYRVVYTPTAVVFHVGGAYAKGRRFDLRYTFYGARNHVVLLHHALGPDAPETRQYRHAIGVQALDQVRYALDALRDSERSTARKARGAANGLSRAAVILAGSVAGGWAARSVARPRPHAATPRLPSGSWSHGD